MHFRDILGLQHIKKHLTTTVKKGRVPHAQLFIGTEGSGILPMAIAYAQYILCNNENGENEGGNTACNIKCEALTHPDLHFAFPVANSESVKSHAVSDSYLAEWRQFIKTQPYGNLFDWYRMIGIEKKQGIIGKDEAQDIVKKLSLKSYEGGYKVLIIWMAEKMNGTAANKLLKLIEEPPSKTVIILITNNEEQIINTIKSRCQALHFPPLAEETIANALKNKGLSESEANRLAHEAHGDYNKALSLCDSNSEDLIFEKWFVQWVRSAFKAKGNKAAIQDLILWSDELAKNGREVQKKYLKYCIAIVRQALLLHYKAPQLVYSKIHVDGFDLKKFAPFIHGNNIELITEELEKAIYHVERNGNAKLIFTDLSIKLTRLLHTKAA
ncbi:MAG: DNA polymerase III subunit delta' [Croceitalea sp.]|nr:DNA polymerase III subunit delta' [Croceitalea sp.]NNC35595.1 DNA polymerase III subunit delta' [Croceitalea sp.]NNL09052.1 DNA polymerase III subunit delta' [Croceitalea sp.]NNM18645.1 DNA polymerase III subunit delta' [Croceitalea sp.]